MDGPVTLNGLILEHMQTIPEPGTSLRLDHYAMEIKQTADNAVKTVKVSLILPEISKEDNTSW